MSAFTDELASAFRETLLELGSDWVFTKAETGNAVRVRAIMGDPAFGEDVQLPGQIETAKFTLQVLKADLGAEAEIGDKFQRLSTGLTYRIVQLNSDDADPCVTVALQGDDE